MGKRALQLTLLLIFISTANAASTTLFYAVTKGRRYVQTSPNPPALQVAPQAPYRARALLYSTAPTVATVKTPVNNIYTLILRGDHMEYSRDYTSQPPMNSEWPNGNFTYTITSASDGTKNPVMQLSSDFYPSTPRISNFAEAQAIDATQPFTLTWDSLQRPAQDFAYLRIELNGSLIFETAPIPGAPGALNGASTSLTIPAARFQEGKIYTASLTSWHAIARNTTIPGAQGQTAYTIETTFPIRARFSNLDVRQYGFERRVNYEQNIGIPALRTNAYEVIAFAQGARTNAISSATYKTALGIPRTLTKDGWNYQSIQTYPGSNLMDPLGLYEITIVTAGNGTQTNRLGFTTPDFPGTLQIANLDQAQYVKPASAFTLFWTSPDGGPGDLMHLVITDGFGKIFETPSVLTAPGVINGAARSIAIPAHTFAGEKSYTATLRIFRPHVTDSFTYQGSIGIAAASRMVRFPIKTASGPTPQPILELPRRFNNQTELRFNSIRGETYRIQTSINVTVWNNAHTFTAADTITTWLSPSATNEGQFYRIIAGP